MIGITDFFFEEPVFILQNFASYPGQNIKKIAHRSPATETIVSNHFRYPIHRYTTRIPSLLINLTFHLTYGVAIGRIDE